MTKIKVEEVREISENLLSLMYRHHTNNRSEFEIQAAKFKSAIIFTVTTINTLILNERQNIEDLKKEKLDLNALEAEGFVRGLLTLKDELVEYESVYAGYWKDEK